MITGIPSKSPKKLFRDVDDHFWEKLAIFPSALRQPSQFLNLKLSDFKKYLLKFNLANLLFLLDAAGISTSDKKSKKSIIDSLIAFDSGNIPEPF